MIPQEDQCGSDTQRVPLSRYKIQKIALIVRTNGKSFTVIHFTVISREVYHAIPREFEEEKLE